MKRIATFCGFAWLLAGSMFGADVTPEFSEEGVKRVANALMGLIPPPLKGIAPGNIISIAGRGLGPETACQGFEKAAPPTKYLDQREFPTELCETQVFVDGKLAALVSVAATKIELRVPDDSPESGSVALVVIYRGVSSVPVTLPAVSDRTIVSLDQPAHTDSAVWLRIHLRVDSAPVGFPGQFGWARFGCNLVEVRRDGQLLTPLAGATRRPPWAQFGTSCQRLMIPAIAPSAEGAFAKRHTGRLPVHALYRFDVPGRYEVRYGQLDDDLSADEKRQQIRGLSEWTTIEILPAAPEERRKWLDDIRQRAPSDPAELLTDVLPGLIGLPDEESFDILAGYFYHPDFNVCGYVYAGMAYWPRDFVARKIAELIRVRGTSANMIRQGLNNEAVLAELGKSPSFARPHRLNPVPPRTRLGRAWRRLATATSFMIWALSPGQEETVDHAGNFVRIHQSLRVTPAMVAGVTDRLWSIEDLVRLLP